MTEDDPRGHHAGAPTEIPSRGWKEILWRVKDQTFADHVSVVSAGVAFFGLLAIFPAIAALVSIAGFFLDPSQVVSQLDAVMALLPEDAASIIQNQVVAVTGGEGTATGFAAIFGLVLALYGATKGMMTLMEGMNIAYDEREKRGFVALYLSGVLLTLVLIVGLLGAFAVMIFIPVALDFAGLPDRVEQAIMWLQWPLLAVLTMLGLSLIYRFGPSRENPKWRWVSPGAVVATVLWLIGTVAFSIYARNFGSYNETYGALGGAIVLLTWLWLSSFIVLLGAELDSEMEHQTRRDTTTGDARPMGERGAVKADTTPEAVGAQRRPRDRRSGAELGEILQFCQKRPLLAGILGTAAILAILNSEKR